MPLAISASASITLNRIARSLPWRPH